MLSVTIEDFYKKASACHVMTRQEEIECAKKMKAGDTDARALLIESYMPMVVSFIKRQQPDMQKLGLVLYCQQTLEKLVDSFDFLQDNEPFSHRLNWGLRQAAVQYRVR